MSNNATPDYIKKTARRYSYNAALDVIKTSIDDITSERVSRLKEVNHYTSLEVIQKVLSTDDIRLTHAEYSNDQAELSFARNQIRDFLQTASNPTFRNLVWSEYINKASELDAYVFCTSEGEHSKVQQQDILSQWRAYGADGRGGCMTLRANELSDLASNLIGLQLNPVIYDPMNQSKLIQMIFSKGEADHRNHVNSAVETTASALVNITPIMKSPGFSEENEWRIIFIPAPDIDYDIYYQPRRDFLAPYVTIRSLCSVYYNNLLKSSEYSDEQSKLLNLSVRSEYVPVDEIMVGPSGHQTLNRRTFSKVIDQAAKAIRLAESSITYRSLA